jgi:quercetin dioxygenase-like cupin family protein
MTVKRKDEQRVEHIVNHRGGSGEIAITYCVEKSEYEYPGLNHICLVTVPAGVSVGPHDHAGKMELIYITEGECIYNDGSDHLLQPGDCAIVAGEKDIHQLKNPRETPLKYLAFIIN